MDLPSPEYHTTYGVNSQSVLNRSRYFHVVDGLSPDIMHDVLEGSLVNYSRSFSALHCKEKLGRI